VAAVCVFEPDVASAPDQDPLGSPPTAVQLPVADEDQVSVKVLPLVTEVGLTVRVTVGPCTFTWACAVAAA